MSNATPPATLRRRVSFLPDKTERAEASDDYSLQKLPYHWRRTPTALAFALSGIVWSVFSLSLGGQAALSYGLFSTLIATGIAAVCGAIACGTISRVTANAGMSLDLVTRGSGYGFIGSSATSLIYAATYLMYSGFEAALMADAVHTQWPSLNLPLLYVASSLIIVPLNWYGFQSNDFLQRITTPLFLAGFIWLAIKVFTGEPATTVIDPAFPISFENVTGALSAIIPVAAIISLNAADYSRFMRKRDARTASRLAPVIVIGGILVLEVPIGALLSVWTGEGNASTYAATVLGPVGVLWIVITQLRIQNANFYSGTLALANFASRVLKFVPGRKFWILFMALVTVVATLAGILNSLLSVLTFLGIFIVSWFGTIAADMLILRPSGRALPHYIEHRRGYLKSWGWPSVGSLLAASACGIILEVAQLPTPQTSAFWSLMAALLIGFGGPLLIVGVLRRGGNLTARAAEPGWIDDETMTDEALEAPENLLPWGEHGELLMKQDLVTCPVTPGGIISSVACASHRTCHDACKAPGVLIPLASPAHRETRPSASSDPIPPDATSGSPTPSSATSHGPTSGRVSPTDVHRTSDRVDPVRTDTEPSA